MTYRIATGKQQVRKVFTLQIIAPMAEQGFAACFSLHAGVMSNAQDRRLLEKLCRYLFWRESRSGVSEKSLAITTYDKVRYPLKTPFRDGTTGGRRSHAILEPLDFIARLVALVPKPRVNLTRLDEKHPCFSSFGQPRVVPIHSRWICHGVFVRGGPRGAFLAGLPSSKQSTPRDNNTRLTK